MQHMGKKSQTQKNKSNHYLNNKRKKKTKELTFIGGPEISSTIISNKSLSATAI
jgi:hypothetical protein